MKAINSFEDIELGNNFEMTFIDNGKKRVTKEVRCVQGGSFPINKNSSIYLPGFLIEVCDTGERFPLFNIEKVFSN